MLGKYLFKGTYFIVYFIPSIILSLLDYYETVKHDFYRFLERCMISKLSLLQESFTGSKILVKM